jgi:hypothetical protein
LDPNELEDYGAIHRAGFRIQKFLRDIYKNEKSID